MDEFNKRLCSALDTFSDPVVEKIIFAYTKSDVEIASDLIGKSRYFEGDFSANDKSQLVDVHEIFAHWLKRSGAPSWFRKFYIENSRTFRVVSYEYGVSAEIQNQLATGGTDTTGRNSLWNLCLWYSFCQFNSIKSTAVAILGDDIAAGTDEHGIDCTTWQAHCLGAGMRLKAQERRFHCDLTFLSRFFAPVEDSECMIPLIGKALCRFNARANRNASISDDEYMAGKSLSYAYEFRHVGYMRDRFLARFSQCNVSIEGLLLHDLTWFAKQGVSSVHDVYRKVLTDPLVMSDDCFLEIIMAKYDLGLYDLGELCDRLLNSSALEVFDDERYHNFRHEVE